MDNKFILELVNTISPYIIAILGILSPVFTIRYLNSQDLIKFKKQQMHNVKTKIYPKFIIEFNELKRMFDIIIQMADFYKSEEKDFETFRNEYKDEKHIQEVYEYTQKYDEVINNCERNIKKMYDENFSYLNKSITKKIKDILESLNSADFLFYWKMDLPSSKESGADITFDYLKNLYLAVENDAKKKSQKINDLVISLKYEINGEK